MLTNVLFFKILLQFWDMMQKIQHCNKQIIQPWAREMKMYVTILLKKILANNIGDELNWKLSKWEKDSSQYVYIRHSK